MNILTYSRPINNYKTNINSLNRTTTNYNQKCKIFAQKSSRFKQIFRFYRQVLTTLFYVAFLQIRAELSIQQSSNSVEDKVKLLEDLLEEERMSAYFRQQ